MSCLKFLLCLFKRFACTRCNPRLILVIKVCTKCHWLDCSRHLLAHLTTNRQSKTRIPPLLTKINLFSTPTVILTHMAACSSLKGKGYRTICQTTTRHNLCVPMNCNSRVLSSKFKLQSSNSSFYVVLLIVPHPYWLVKMLGGLVFGVRQRDPRSSRGNQTISSLDNWKRQCVNCFKELSYDKFERTH